MANLLRRLRARWRYRHFDRDLTQEIETHRAMKQSELEASGVAFDDARAMSARALGNVTYMREEARSIWIARWLEHLWQDLRYALRGLRRQPLFAITAIGILGLTAGLLTTLMVFLDASLLRPWRVPDPSSVFLIRPAGRLASDLQAVRVPEYFFIREHGGAWRGLAMTADGPEEDLTFANGAVASAGTLHVTSNYFATLGMPLFAGAGFTADDDGVSPRDAVIISHRIWREHLGGDPDAVGSTVRIRRLRDRALTIVGIAPKGFVDGHSSRNEVWMPLMSRLGSTPEARRAYFDPRHSVPGSMDFFGRVADGVTPSQALEQLKQLSGAYRSTAGIEPTGFRLVDTRPITRNSDNEVFQALLLVGAGLLLVQLLACANVGNLLLVRALARQREIAVRLSLGAGRWRVVRQLLTEAALLITIAAGLGLAIALTAPHVVIRYLPDWEERPEFYGPGLATFALLITVAGVSTIVAGLAPAVRATSVGLATIAGSRHGQGRGGVRLRRMLLAAQLTLATVLLSGAMLLTRGVSHALGIDPGFPVAEFQEVTIQLPAGSQRDRRALLFGQLYERTRSAEWPPLAFADIPPIDSQPLTLAVRVETPSGTQLRMLRHRPVSADYFDVLGVPLLTGRMPSAKADPEEIALNRLAADLLFPGENPVGKTVTTGFRANQLKTQVIVGVTPTLPTETVAKSTAVAYGPTGLFSPRILVRSRNPDLMTRLQSLVTSIDPAARVTGRPLTEMVADTLYFARVGSRVAWAIGMLGLVLASVGAFGVFAYAVEERRREVGIRMALGARPAQVIELVLRSMGGTVILGLGIGLALSAAASPLLRSYLYGLSPFDLQAYVLVMVILAASAALATWLPARRATRVNPAEALRAE